VVAFRLSDLDLRDPHVFVTVITCSDVTDTPVAGLSINGELQTHTETDSGGDGLLDESIALVFPSFDQTAATQPVQIFSGAACTAPLANTSCTPGGAATITSTATYLGSGTCLQPLPGTTHPYVPAITSASAPCFVTAPLEVTIDLAGLPLKLIDARFAATYLGNPATHLANGLLMGFMTVTQANNTQIPVSFPVIGGQSLSSILPGGATNCSTKSDEDSDSGAAGWWFYFNFPAASVPWSAP
jgi:hypothetical protein